MKITILDLSILIDTKGFPMNYDEPYEEQAYQTLRNFALVGLRSLKNTKSGWLFPILYPPFFLWYLSIFIPIFMEARP